MLDAICLYLFTQLKTFNPALIVSFHVLRWCRGTDLHRYEKECFSDGAYIQDHHLYAVQNKTLLVHFEFQPGYSAPPPPSTCPQMAIVFITTPPPNGKVSSKECLRLVNLKFIGGNVNRSATVNIWCKGDNSN